eukprot:161342-Pleurochrysis_carterae.AAC.1
MGRAAMVEAMGGAAFTPLVIARASADVGASSLAQRARPEPSVENAMSTPAPQESIGSEPTRPGQMVSHRWRRLAQLSQQWLRRSYLARLWPWYV